MVFIAIEWNRILNLVRCGVNADSQIEIAQCPHHYPIKLRDRTRLELDHSPAAIAFLDVQLMINKIERDLEREMTVWNR